MTLPTIYEDAISCFCPRTAFKLRYLVEYYISTGKRPYLNARISKTSIAVLKLIFNDIENRVLKKKTVRNHVQKTGSENRFRNSEDETKEKLSDEKNKTLLPPTPPINKTIKAENGIEKKEELNKSRRSNTRAREEISADTENTNSVGLKSDGQEAKTSEPKTEGVTTEKKKEADEEKC